MCLYILMIFHNHPLRVLICDTYCLNFLYIDTAYLRAISRAYKNIVLIRHDISHISTVHYLIILEMIVIFNHLAFPRIKSHFSVKTNWRIIIQNRTGSDDHTFQTRFFCRKLWVKRVHFLCSFRRDRVLMSIETNLIQVTVSNDFAF